MTDTSKEQPKATTTIDEDIENLSHEDLLEITSSSIKRLIASDPLFSDLPVDVTPEEVLAQIAVIQGQSITVTVLRYSESPLSVVIPQQKTTVLDLKKSIKRHFTLKQQRQRSKTKISWKYVWKTYWLQNIANGKILKNDGELVSNYGIVNR
ncbi:U11/U12 small nuclear ribonucleoprotein 25 kDa protein-like [Anthonomus grandis grandis]|uniref:U11/U12 small nuclear ribonucleoprotein 25 kDa protein-like n=1 Tax=Anthonomus grandis grandis TaxID=2921223 RepID=UPI0021663644|nr:U11/U12 small nuclear ribonucleoprotein 25 kDa protein-like [Anthonomus grandis grandis]